MTKPRLLLLATGGTIAGIAPTAASTLSYAPASLGADSLIASVPALGDLADITTETPFSTGSQHITSAHWLTLAARVREASVDPLIDAIVITHGTDTLEETALFLDLTCPRDKAVVLTGAMRPATALSADGPMNLYAAAALAVSPASRGAGAIVLMNDQGFGPDRAAKVHTSRVDAFVARGAMPLALMIDGKAVWQTPAALAAGRRPSLAAHFADLPPDLPRVDLLAQQVDGDPAIVDWCLQRGARGIVLAGTGHGSISRPIEAALGKASERGCLVVRASRISDGPVMHGASVDDDRFGFIAAGFVTPHKARLLLSLLIAARLNREAARAMFASF
jgi:L-asparaginase